jgi:nucleoside-diphosphate-sugar epimerase
VRALITGGAGYIGSLLAGRLLAEGHDVIVVDRLLFGGDSILPYLPHPAFAFHRRDVADQDLDDLLTGVDVVYHLAALVGFPACRDAGEAVARRFNVDSTKRAFEAAERCAVGRFVLASTYSNYGRAVDDRPVTETSELDPQSIYAVTKIEAERYLLGRAADRGRCAPIIPRFTTLFGLSPRTRFDLIVNQFVLEALTQRRLVIYEGDFRRSFVHVSDIVRALVLFAEAPLSDVRAEIFNVGHEHGNHTKTHIVELVTAAIPGVEVERRQLTFGGDMRDVAVSCAKIRERLGFRAATTVEQGIVEVRDAVLSGLIKEPTSARYRNHSFSVQ